MTTLVSYTSQKKSRRADFSQSCNDDDNDILFFCPVYNIIITLNMSCVIYSVHTSVTSHMMSINGA